MTFVSAHINTYVYIYLQMFFETDLSDSDFDDCTLLLVRELLKSKKKKRKYWVHPINKLGEKKGEFHRLVEELEADEERFKLYFRTNKTQLEEIHLMIENDIKKLNTKFRQSIGNKERLARCLRYLATGCSNRSLGFNYRLDLVARKPNS